MSDCNYYQGKLNTAKSTLLPMIALMGLTAAICVGMTISISVTAGIPIFGPALALSQIAVLLGVVASLGLLILGLFLVFTMMFGAYVGDACLKCKNTKYKDGDLTKHENEECHKVCSNDNLSKKMNSLFVYPLGLVATAVGALLAAAAFPWVNVIAAVAVMIAIANFVLKWQQFDTYFFTVTSAFGKCTL